jgi:dipeptide/tripeptide permease
MKKEYKYYTGIGAAAFLAAITLQIFWSGIDTIWVSRITSILITVGIVCIAHGVGRHMIYKERPEEDERTKKISALTLSYSWIVTLVLVGVLLLLDKWDIFKMTVMQALGLTMFVMIVVAIVAELYLKRKGDIE